MQFLENCAEPGAAATEGPEDGEPSWRSSTLLEEVVLVLEQNVPL